ncbi:MAG TPA: hypothetical protein PKD64_18480 [Pirellulaceae bacterium]|nr:hypothetical protein [Pirellulaceae bacterium]HMO94177.1 hypothetical protein [Pirellulaceae bacterium]HMP71202.1 hypothetical protein [Pirellulaceae bacterium]
MRSSFLTGYVLWLSLIFLTLFNLRKKLTMLPKLGSAAFWMQAHIYVGLGTFAVFGLHVGWRFPTGGFDRILAALYWFVALSGIYGLYLTRTVPRRLTQIRVEPIFEAIPRLRYQLLQKATAIMDEQFENNEVLRPVYYRKLRPFFENDRGPWYMLFPSARKSRALVAEIQKQHRYLSPADRRASSALAQLVRECDDLDYHRAMQGRLKVWLIVHVSCTYSLLIVATWHGVMAHAFSGVLR